MCPRRLIRKHAAVTEKREEGTHARASVIQGKRAQLLIGHQPTIPKPSKTTKCLLGCVIPSGGAYFSLQPNLERKEVESQQRSLGLVPYISAYPFYSRNNTRATNRECAYSIFLRSFCDRHHHGWQGLLSNHLASTRKLKRRQEFSSRGLECGNRELHQSVAFVRSAKPSLDSKKPRRRPRDCNEDTQ